MFARTTNQEEAAAKSTGKKTVKIFCFAIDFLRWTNSGQLNVPVEILAGSIAAAFDVLDRRLADCPDGIRVDCRFV